MEIIKPQQNIYIQRRSFDFVEATRALATNNPHTIVTTEAQFQRMLQFLWAAPEFAFDTETSGLAWFRHARICGMSFTVRPQPGQYLSWYVPIRHLTSDRQLAPEYVLPRIAQLLADPVKVKIAHNWPFDWHMCLADGMQVCGPRRDTMVEGQLQNENLPAALKDRAAMDLQDPRAHEFEKLLGKEIGRRAKQAKMKIKDYKDCFGYSHIPPWFCGVYACFDTEFTFRLADFYDSQRIRQTYQAIYDDEIRLQPALVAMEETGMPVSREHLMTVKHRTEEAMWDIEPTIFEALDGYTFNIGSDAELRDVLVNRLRVPLHKTTKTKALSVDAEALGEFEDRYAVIPLIMKYRGASKINSTYTDSILDKLDANDILHGSLLGMGANTGRMASKGPNLQNFANDSNERAIEFTGLALENGGRDPWSVKTAFTPHTFGEAPSCRLFLDYSQIELRVLAYYSQDPTMLDVYLNDEDIHARTQLEVFNSKAKADRRKAKVINFGLSYMLSAKGFSRQAKIPYADAERFMAIFFQRYPRIAPFRKEFFGHCRANGNQFTNLFGRPRRVPALSSDWDFERGRAERQAIGTLIQGTAAQLMKRSIVRVFEWQQREGVPLKLTCTIHDELQGDMRHKDAPDIAYEMREKMEDYTELYPLIAKTDVEITHTNWAEKKDYECTMISTQQRQLKSARSQSGKLLTPTTTSATPSVLIAK